MGRFRHIAAWMLLVTIVTGGFLGPSLHRVHHAIERAAEESCHTDQVHNAEGPALAEEAAVSAAHCTLCVPRLLVVLPAVESMTAPTVLVTPPGKLKAHLAPIHVFTDRTIRGPPHLS